MPHLNYTVIEVPTILAVTNRDIAQAAAVPSLLPALAVAAELPKGTYFLTF
jgi:hypothetical protein